MPYRVPAPPPAPVRRPLAIEPLERRILYATFDIAGVHALAIDQPQIHALFRNTPTGDPLGGTGPDDGIAVKAYLDTGTSSILLSQEQTEAMGIEPAEFNDEPVIFSDVGVAGTEDFYTSGPLYMSLAPVRSVFDGELPVEAFDQTVGPVRTQINQHESDPLLGEINLVGMPALRNKVMVVDLRPPNQTDPLLVDSSRTYVYSPGTPFNPADDEANPGIPQTNRHVKFSYGDFSRYTLTTPTGAAGPTLAHNPIIGADPTGSGGGSAPGITVSLGGRSATGNFLFDTGAVSSFMSETMAAQLNVRYREQPEPDPGDPDPPPPVLEDFNGNALPGQFSLTFGGIGGFVTVAGFNLGSLTLPTVEGEPIRFLDAPMLVLDVTAVDPRTGQSLTLDGDLGMNYFFPSASTDLGESSGGAFDWMTFDEPGGVLGVDLRDADLIPTRPTVQSVLVNDGSAQRSKVAALTVTFDQAVTLDAGAFAVSRRPVGDGPTVQIGLAGATSLDGRTWVLTFAAADTPGGSLADGVYDLAVRAGAVHAVAGTMTADHAFAFHRLFNDADGDGDSDNADLFQMRSAYGKSAADSQYRWYMDYEADGDVDNADLLQVRSRRFLTFKGY